MPYNLTSIATNASSVIGFIQGVDNVLMFGWLGTFFLISICFVLLSSFYFSTGDVKKSFAATSFISVGLSILLFAMGLIPDTVFFISIIVSGLTSAFTWK
jgi:hypothetical protein